MTEFLTFTLTGALGAFGELAGLERRDTLAWPGRSALLGLIAAAMGIRRTDSFAEIEPLQMAVAVYPDDGLCRDFHTFQSVPSVVKRPATRAAALASGRAVTSLTQRDYRQSPLFGIAVWNGPLARVAEALRRPVFALYLGRKSCPLAWPVFPQIAQADGPLEALGGVVLPPWRSGAVPLMVASDAHPKVPGDEIEQRMDDPLDRSAWHFASRSVRVVRMEGAR